MVRAPLVAAVALLAVAVFAPLAAAQAEGPTQFNVEWRTRQAVFPYEGHLEEGDAKAFRFLVEQPNVTSVRFLLLWGETDDRAGLSGPDEFTLEARRPDGSVVGGAAQTSATGRVLLEERELNPVPERFTLTAESEAAAQREADVYQGEEGLGAWTATVWLDSTGNPRGVDSDPGNQYELRVVLTYYEASVMRVVSLEPQVGDSGGFWAAAAKEDPVWLWTTGGLAAAATGLGLMLVVDAVRRRRGRDR